ncbi:MAG: hypothetical protein ACFB16_18750 [Phormidesmis sp.]
MATLRVYFRTGGDDLREGSWANFFVKLINQPEIKFEKITEGKKLDESSDFERLIDVPALTSPEQVESFRVEHVSQESLGQTRDNWNILRAEVKIASGRFPIVVGEYGYHRFDGNSPSITIAPPLPV